MRGKLTENAKWTVLLHAVNLLFWLQFAANGIMARCGGAAEAAGIRRLLCGAQTLTLLIGSWILFMMPGKKEERSRKKERILAAVNILTDQGIILLFILQMVTGKYYPFAAV